MTIVNIGKTKYIRAKDIMAMMSIGRSTIDDWARRGILTRYKVQGSVFYLRSEVEGLLDG